MVVVCGMQVVWCATITELRNGDEYRIAATCACAGVAFVLAGFTMLIGMFVCCCCKAPAPEAPMPVKYQVPSSFRATHDAFYATHSFHATHVILLMRVKHLRPCLWTQSANHCMSVCLCHLDSRCVHSGAHRIVGLQAATACGVLRPFFLVCYISGCGFVLCNLMVIPAAPDRRYTSARVRCSSAAAHYDDVPRGKRGLVIVVCLGCCVSWLFCLSCMAE